jgi:hypothetical protein
MHAFFVGKMKVDDKQLTEAVERRLCNLKRSSFESNLLTLNNGREQVKELWEQPTLINFAVRNAMLASDVAEYFCRSLSDPGHVW